MVNLRVLPDRVSISQPSITYAVVFGKDTAKAVFAIASGRYDLDSCRSNQYDGLRETVTTTQQQKRRFLTHFSVVPAMSSAEQCYWNNISERRDWRYWIVFMTAVSMSFGTTLAAEPDDQSSRVVYKNLEVRAAAINKNLAVGIPTVDIAIYLGETNGQPHPYVASPDELKASFERAKDIFAQAGVQLRLLFVKRVTVPAAWLSLQANKVTGVSVFPKINAYVGFRLAKWKLTNEAKRAFEGIIQKHADNHRTIYLLYLKQVRMAYFDRSNPTGPKIKSIPTGGLSLPSYLFEARIPRRIRGVITICRRSGKGGRTMAHELGHKLINVSHEYRKISPQFEVRGKGGLMIYGKGTDIPSGKAGRWQKERLHRSPYIYRMKADKTRTWNADYRENGHYYDPLYGDKVIRFGIMEHPKPNK